jgi:hypothetical protein
LIDEVRPVRPMTDAAIGASLCAAALFVGLLYCRAFERSGAAPEPWVKELSAAIAFACGHGYVDLGYEPTPAVAAFLAKRVDSLSCGDVPAAPAAPPNFTQSHYRYMTLAVGATWRLLGVSWTSLAALFGVLYAVSAGALYGIFRLGVTRLTAAAAVAVLIASPLELRYLPQLRDYAKTPFILALVLVLGLLAMRPFGARRLLALAAVYGAVMGIGFGFRNDLLINIVPFVVTVALFLPVPLLSQLRAKTAALVVCAALFVACSWPILTAYRSGSNTGHVALLGLMTAFNGPLGVTPSVYDWGSPYDDGFVMKMVGAFAQRVHHAPAVVLSADYDRAAVEYLARIARHWPADLATRAWASLLRILELPFQVRSYTTAIPPAIDPSGIAARLYSVWDAIASRLSGIGVPVTAIAVVGVAGSSVRAATFLVAALAYFGGYPALQFDPRHFFFLEFIPWIALALAWDGVRRGMVLWRDVRRGRQLPSDVVPGMRRAAAFAAALVLVGGGVMIALRTYQQHHVLALIERYVEQPAEALALTPEPAADGQVLLRPDKLSRAPERRVRAEYLAIDIAGRNCNRLVTPITLRYATTPGFTDISERIFVPPPSGADPFRLFFPIYYSEGAYFAGIEVPDHDVECIAGARRLQDLGALPLLVNLLLPPDWRQMPMYQTLTNWEAPSAPYRIHVYTWPRLLDPARFTLTPAPPPDLASMSHSSLVTSDEAGRWIVRGFTRAPTSFLVRLPERPVPQGTSFVARGTLYRGGFTLGLLRDQLWTTTVNVTAPGEFLAIVEASDGGTYAPAFANYLTGINRRNALVVSAAEWSSPARPGAAREARSRTE